MTPQSNLNAKGDHVVSRSFTMLDPVLPKILFENENQGRKLSHRKYEKEISKKTHHDNLISVACCFPNMRKSKHVNAKESCSRENSTTEKSNQLQVKISTRHSISPRNGSDSKITKQINIRAIKSFASSFLKPEAGLASKNFLAQDEIVLPSSSNQGRDRVAEMKSLSSRDLASDSEVAHVSLLVLLIFEPILKKYQLIQISYDPNFSMVGDIVRFVTVHAPEFSFRKQNYVGLCRLAQSGMELLNCFLLKKYAIKENEVLVAVPRGWSAKACCKLATPILKLSDIKVFIDRLKLPVTVSKNIATIEENDLRTESNEMCEIEGSLLSKNKSTKKANKNIKKCKHTSALNFPSDAILPEQLSMSVLDEEKRQNGNDEKYLKSDDTASTITMPTMETDSVNKCCNIIVLVMEPISCNFMLLLLQLDCGTTASDLLGQVETASKKLFSKQMYVGLCQIDGREIAKNALLLAYGICAGGVLIAIPKGLGVASCSLLAKPIMRDPNLTGLIKMAAKGKILENGNHINNLFDVGLFDTVVDIKSPAVPKVLNLIRMKKNLFQRQPKKRPGSLISSSNTISDALDKQRPSITEDTPKKNNLSLHEKTSDILNLDLARSTEGPMASQRLLRNKADTSENKLFSIKSNFGASFSSTSKETVISLPSITEDDALDLSIGNKEKSVSIFYVLVMNLLTRRFALLIQYQYETSLVAGVLDNAVKSMSKKILKNQSFVGLCRLNGQELVNCFKMQKYNLVDGELLIAIPKGLGGATCVQLAQPILNYPQIKDFLELQEKRKPDPFVKDDFPYEALKGVVGDQSINEINGTVKARNSLSLLNSKESTLASF
eukprot:CAMPEP_0194300290 /NCGR_PEP_ID=MMETSP0169-20130528/61177_1 /TAXON_ID=218684 /ORGANISM="Corethron pennatum, Strain L29A3" /LENGTH=836 /DNA_ID=CAMNT_0039050445 /DNA_START=126 /DNA_END=2636 /DNA_ORIENTATION=+